MMDNRYQEHIEELQRQGLHRRMRVLESATGTRVRTKEGEKVVFCSNNYLGLSNDRRIKEAVREGLEEWGFGSGGSRLICGNATPHERLQRRLAGMLNKEASLVFTSGYETNHAILTTLPQQGDLIAIDKLVHASIIDGAKASRAVVRTWAHRNVDKLKRLLERGGYKRAFIVTDSLFSMDGDRADLKALAEIKKHYEAILMVDEAHAMGCIGPMGTGCGAEEGVLEDIDIIVATFSKAFGGAGGFAAGPKAMIDYLVNKSRGFIYTTGIPAIHCVAAETALDIIAEEPQRRQRLLRNGEYFRQKCAEMGLNIGKSTSYIVPVILGSAEKATHAAKLLFDRGFMVPAIREPTVRAGEARLRVSLMSEHTKEDIDGLLGAMEDCTG